MRIFEKILSFLSVAFVTLHASNPIVEPFHEGEVPAVGLCATSPLYLGQDEGVESLRLQIHLGVKDDLIYPNLLWHYRMGVRHFGIVSHGLTANQSKKITMFFDRVKDICTLNLIETPGVASGSASDLLAVSTTSSDLKWHLELTDRQFLCLQRPLEEILVEDSTSTLVFPSCTYSGFDPDAPLSFWPQTDERLIYRTPITHDAPFTFTNLLASGSAKQSGAAYVANYAAIEDAVPFTVDLIKDRLPFMEVIKNSIQHACHREKDWSEDYWFVPPNMDHPLEKILDYFILEVGFNRNIRFGQNYIYVPVEKCGCSTIARAHGSYEAGRIVSFPAYKEFHRSPRGVKERYKYLLDNSLYKFTCVRNPYTRILSAYCDKILRPGNKAYKGCSDFEVNKTFSFLEFLKQLKKKQIRTTDTHFTPAWSAALIPIIYYNKIVRLENFDAEFKEVMDHIGIPGKPSDYKWDEHATNASGKLSDYYTSECAELVRDIYAKDFEYFGYSKAPHFALHAPITSELVINYYNFFLKREPESEAAVISNLGKNPNLLLTQFIDSSEYQDISSKEIVTREFVISLCRAFLKREPESAAFVEEKLGKNPRDLILEFLSSEEYKEVKKKEKIVSFPFFK